MVEGLVEGGFLGDIPAQDAGTTIYYYVSAMLNSGKQGARPMPAPAGWWSFEVLAETNGLNDLTSPSPWHAVYPNPASAITCLELDMPQAQDVSVTVHNMFGQHIQTLHQGSLNRGLQRMFLDASTLVPGPYLLTLTTDDGHRWSHRLVVEH